MATLWHGTALLTFYNVGTVLVIAKASGMAVVPPAFLAVLGVGLVYDLYVLLLANKYLKRGEAGEDTKSE